jgi:hypothetical protein
VCACVSGRLWCSVINRETRVKASIAQQVLERDLDFMAPQPRELAGRLYVPMMRLCIIQTELVLHVLKDQLQYSQDGAGGKPNKDRQRKESRVCGGSDQALGLGGDNGGVRCGWQSQISAARRKLLRKIRVLSNEQRELKIALKEVGRQRPFPLTHAVSCC